MPTLPPVVVAYTYSLGGRGQTDEVPCDREQVARALNRPGFDGWSWTLDPISREQADALGVYETEQGDHVLSVDLGSIGCRIFVEVR